MKIAEAALAVTVPSGTFPGVDDVHRSADGWLSLVEKVWSEFDRPRIEIREAIDAGDQVVVGG